MIRPNTIPESLLRATTDPDVIMALSDPDLAKSCRATIKELRNRRWQVTTLDGGPVHITKDLKL